MRCAVTVRLRGVVQGVGFRPFVFRLAQSHALTGWVLNGEDGVEIHLEGDGRAVDNFVSELASGAPPAARIASIDVQPAELAGFREFVIRASERRNRPTARISPDLPVCDDCLRELFDPADRRHSYPYVNCTNCGPRYTVIRGLPYDRPNTTMSVWPLDEYCACEYRDTRNRRFHAQPVACPECGPHYHLRVGNKVVEGDGASINEAANLLRAGRIVAVKGIGGYHLACDARNSGAVLALRERKFRKEKPFALMARDLVVCRGVVDLSSEADSLLNSSARPIVLAPAKTELAGVAPGNDELGVMLPHNPLHHLLFASGAPDLLVMTSANRSSEPIAYLDDDALDQLSAIADAFLIGERPIARRVDDSVARAGVLGPMILRRARGYAPGAVTTLPTSCPILAVGADLKNAITLVVEGQAFVSQHIGDLDHYESYRAFQEAVQDLVSMYEVRWDDLLVAHDAHPHYLSTALAATLPAARRVAVQHHRAHIASVLAEREAWTERVFGVSLDGTGYGDDGSIWGGEFFTGSIPTGFERVGHLRPAVLAGGDAAAQFPVQAAAGFLSQLDSADLPDLAAPPFEFPARYRKALELVTKSVRTFPTTSMGRLFDTAAALVGFTHEISFEGQAAIWLEHLAARCSPADPYPFPLVDRTLDFRPLLKAVIGDRRRGRDPSEIARAFQLGVAVGLADAIKAFCVNEALDTVAMSGGVFQNELLLRDLKTLLGGESLNIWTNHGVPPNDGGISLGQAALAAFAEKGQLESAAELLLT